VLNMALDRRALERVAGELRGFDSPCPIRFRLAPPSSAAAGRTWDSVTRFLMEQTRTAGPDHGPLVRSQLLRLATAALLEAYPSTFTAAEDAPAGGASASAVRRAMAYVDLYAGDDIGLTDIAAAARLSVRGLQAAFRRHADTTPLAHLRWVRLHRAHAELCRRAPHETTVGAVAARWGFANPSRFSAEHRRAFGTTPGQALRDA
jgi:transcriptional regulator GlxA family with amidase domain